jgi:hypothetical protein
MTFTPGIIVGGGGGVVVGGGGITGGVNDCDNNGGFGINGTFGSSGVYGESPSRGIDPGPVYGIAVSGKATCREMFPYFRFGLLVVDRDGAR